MKNNITNTLSLWLLLAFVVASNVYGVTNVFFAGGQSNAHADWASGVEAGLKNSGKFGEDILVVHSNHSGKALFFWYYGGTPRELYEIDFYNDSGTGVLQSALADLDAAGTEYEFKGLLWFQGEGDSGAANNISSYNERFHGMLEQLQADMGLSKPIPFTLAVIDANPDLFYDDPENLKRTRQQIEDMRAVQFAMGKMAGSVAVDSRGYRRSDAWHLIQAESIAFGTEMGTAHAELVELPESKSSALLLGFACVSMLIFKYLPRKKS